MRTKTVLDQYFIDIGKYPALSAKEEKKITTSIYENLIRYKKEGIGLFITSECWPQIEDSIKQGEKDRERLINSNQPLVISIAKKYKNKGLPLEDLIQEGNIGLLRAVELNNPYLGNRFFTYACHWIKKYIRSAIIEKSHLIRIPSNTYKRLPAFEKTKTNLTKKLSGEPTNKEIAIQMKIPEKSVEGLKAANLVLYKNKNMVRIDRPAKQDNRNSEIKIKLNKVNLIEKKQEQEYLENLIENSIMNPRDREIIKMLYGLNDYKEMTLEDIGKKFNRTGELIRRVKEKCLSRLYREISRESEYHPIR